LVGALSDVVGYVLPGVDRGAVLAVGALDEECVVRVGGTVGSLAVVNGDQKG
jgi:hypothetical protein